MGTGATKGCLTPADQACIHLSGAMRAKQLRIYLSRLRLFCS